MSGVSHSNPVTAAGFTMIPNVVMLRRDLSLSAKLVYGYLGHLAWRNGSKAVEPVREVIARDLGCSVSAVGDYLRELSKAPAREGDEKEDAARLVTAIRRGLGLTNSYVLNEPEAAESGCGDLPQQEETKGDEPTRGRDRAGKAEEVQEARTPNGVLAQRDAPTAFNPTKVTLVEGRNVGFDALADECAVDPKSPRVGEIGTALNGRPRHPELGIRSLFFGELEHWAGDPETAEGRERLYNVHQALINDPGRFEHAVARAIHEKAAKYRQRMPDGSIVTPTALAKWWLDLERMEDTRGGLTVEGMLNLDA